MPDPVSRPREITLTGADLDPAAVCAIARNRAPVAIAGAARDRIAASNEIVRAVAASGVPAYGVTTGLGSRATEPVADAAGAEFSLSTIRGRATAVGEPLGSDVVRAAMAVRLNGLCAGGAGASVAVAEALAGALNAGLHPIVPASGSVGASDLCLMAHVGLGLIGEGEAELDGERLPAADALRRASLPVLELGPKDGLAICSSSAVSIGAAALGHVDARGALDAAQRSAALAMEGFRANLSPLDARVVAARPAPGQAWAADGLRELLRDGTLAAGPYAEARRVQDPLSFRCAAPIHGSLFTALERLSEAVAVELAAAADNPLVLAGDGEILSTPNFHGPALALALDAVAIAVAQVAHAAAERVARLITPRLSELPATLLPAAGDAAPAAPVAPAARSGVTPLLKTAHALVLEIRHAAAPLAIHGLVGADGVEDDTTGAAQAALRVLDQLGRLRSVIAVELLVAAQAVDVAGVARLGTGTGEVYDAVRAVVAPLTEDRPLGAEVARIRDAVVAAS